MLTPFEYYIETDKFHLKYACGEPLFKGKEFHNYYEFVLFLSGKSKLISKNIQTDLTPGNIVIIPKGHFHQFVIPNPEEYTRCILGFRDTPELFGLISDVMTAVKIFPSPDKNVLSVFENIMNMASSDISKKEKELFLSAALVHLLIFLKNQPAKAVRKNINISSEVRQALNFIDKNFTENISVKSIADILHISASTLSHKFSSELNISVYRYISEKRLSNVIHLMDCGKNISEAAAMSGFSDYSAFFRMYKKHYGKVPSEYR